MSFVIPKRPECYSHETNDCTVKALVATTKRSYEECHSVLKSLGRKDRKGLHLYRFIRDAAELLGHNIEELEFKGSVKRFAKEFSNGNFIITVRGHAIPIVDGVIVDLSFPQKRHVLFVWEIFPKVKQ